MLIIYSTGFAPRGLMKQMKNAISVAEAKYSKEDEFCLFGVFDLSSCYWAFGDDALSASNMNVSPGDTQSVMHD